MKLCGQEKCAQIEYLFQTDLSLLVSFGLAILFRKCVQKGKGAWSRIWSSLIFLIVYNASLMHF